MSGWLSRRARLPPRSAILEHRPPLSNGLEVVVPLRHERLESLGGRFRRGDPHIVETRIELRRRGVPPSFRAAWSWLRLSLKTSASSGR